MLSLLLPLNYQLLINWCYSSVSLFSTTVNVILRVFSFAKSASKHDLRSITDCVLAMSSMVVICLLIVTFLITITGLSAANKNYPPRTIQHVCCNGHEFQLWSSQHSNCQSLDSVLNEPLPNNSVLELTDGSFNLTHSLNFTRVSNITIRGQGSQYTHISCHHMNAGLVFNESYNIELRHFTIDSCGVQINHEKLTNLTGNASKSIVFTNTTNVVLQGLVVANSNGYGLLIHNCFKNMLLGDVIFRSNKLTGPETEHHPRRRWTSDSFHSATISTGQNTLQYQ